MKLRTFLSNALRVLLDIVTLGLYELLRKKFGIKE